MTITTYDVATGIAVEEEISAELIAERAKELKEKEDAIAAAEAKKSAIIAKLGLTADEVSALLA